MTSVRTYIIVDVAAELGLHDELQKETVGLLNERVESFENMPVEFQIYLLVCLLGDFRPSREFFTQMETSPLPVKGCKI